MASPGFDWSAIRDDAIARWAAGSSVDDSAVVFGVKPQTLKGYLHRWLTALYLDDDPRVSRRSGMVGGRIEYVRAETIQPASRRADDLASYPLDAFHPDALDILVSGTGVPCLHPMAFIKSNPCSGMTMRAASA